MIGRNRHSTRNQPPCHGSHSREALTPTSTEALPVMSTFHYVKQIQAYSLLPFCEQVDYMLFRYLLPKKSAMQAIDPAFSYSLLCGRGNL